MEQQSQTWLAEPLKTLPMAQLCPQKAVVVLEL